jgi:hypothetical protein
MVAELSPEAFANFSAIAFDPTGSPVTKCSLIIAVSTVCPRESGKRGFFSIVKFGSRAGIDAREFDAHR